MSVPDIHSLSSNNSHLRSLQARNLSAPDEAAYKQNLAAVYAREIASVRFTSPALEAIYRTELLQLQTLTTAALAALPAR